MLKTASIGVIDRQRDKRINSIALAKLALRRAVKQMEIAVRMQKA